MTSPLLSRLAIGLLAASFAAAPAFASPPPWAGGGNKGGEMEEGRHGKGKDHGGKHGKHADKHAEKHSKHAEKQAEKHGKHGDKHAEKHGGKHGGKHADVRVGGYFSDRDRTLVRTYYGEHYGPGARSCPPGLAKKNNGCMPPGQAKKWAVGQRLPSNVVYYPVPGPVLVQLSPAPAGYRYVRVASDILLIAVGTRMVVDGMSDLLRM